LEPEKFQIAQEGDVAASTFIAWTAVITSFVQGYFSGPQGEDVDTVPRFLHLITALYGTGGAKKENQ